MNIIENLCPPAFLFMLYVVVHIAMDLSLGFYWMAGIKFVTGVIQVFLLNIFCKFDLGVVSWVVISTPFIIMALATSIAMGLQMDKALSVAFAERFTMPLSKDPGQVQAGEVPEPSNPV
jgi:hypothetical protein